MLIRKGFRFRICPNQAQQGRLAVQFGHARFVYNHYLALRSRTYQETGKSLTYTATAGDLVKLKAETEFAWLWEADSQVLQQSLMDLQHAFDNFFRMWRKGTLPSNKGKKSRKDGKPRGYPRFKSRHDEQSVRYPQGYGHLAFEDLNIQCMLGNYAWAKSIQSVISSIVPRSG